VIDRQERNAREARDEAGEKRAVRQDDVRVKARRALERRLHVAAEVDDLEVAATQNAGGAPGRSEPHVVSERHELFGNDARSQRMAEPVARSAVQDPHAE
jgi:hypothetical protein